MSQKLCSSLVTKADGHVLPVCETIREHSDPQLRRALGTIRHLSVDHVHLVGLAAHHAMTYKNDSLWQTAARLLSWRVKLEDRGMRQTETANPWCILDNVLR